MVAGQSSFLERYKIRVHSVWDKAPPIHITVGELQLASRSVVRDLGVMLDDTFTFTNPNPNPNMCKMSTEVHSPTCETLAESVAMFIPFAAEF